MTSETSFAALPVRQRGTLEIIDTAMKLYRRYFGVLMAWSAIVSVSWIFGSIVPFGSLLAYPLTAGSVACCIAAAVRGQTISFAQVWEFTKPRYGALLLLVVLSGLIMSVAFLAVFLLSMLITLGGAWLLSATNAPDEVGIIVGGIAVFLALVVGSVLSVFAYAWLGLIPIIACLEDDKRGVAAMGRAWDLMKGSWRRVLGLATLLTIAVMAVMGIVIGSLALFGSGLGAFLDDPSEAALLGLSFSFLGIFGLFFLFWNPIQTLILAVLYLDLRVRKEALDLEWNSYSSAPPIENSATQAAGQLAQYPPSNGAPVSTSGYLPGSAEPQVAPLEALNPTAPPRPPAPNPAPVVETAVSDSPFSDSSFSSAPAAPESVPEVASSEPNSAFAPAPVSLSKSQSAAESAPDNSMPSSQDAFDFSTSFSPEATQESSPPSKEEDGAK